MGIFRTETMRRAHAVTLGSDWYSQDTIDNTGANTGYRRDCSGWVSYCWRCATSGPGTWGGYSTATFITQGIMFEIPWDQLKPGDAIGYCGPNTAGGGGGHICLFTGWGSTKHGIGGIAKTLEHGSGWGPKALNRTIPSNYKAYRYVGIIEDDGTTYPGSIPSWENNVFCNKGDGGLDVKYLQLRLQALGFKLPKYGADSSWGDETSNAVKASGIGDGSAFGPDEAFKLDQLELAKARGGTDSAAVVSAVRAELAKATVPVKVDSKIVLG